LEALVEIKKDHPGLAVIMMSGYPPAVLLDDCERIGVLYVLDGSKAVADAARAVHRDKGRSGALVLDDDLPRLDEFERRLMQASGAVTRAPDLGVALTLLGEGSDRVVTLPLSMAALGERAALALVLETLPRVTFGFTRAGEEPYPPAAPPAPLRARLLSKPFPPETLLRVLDDSVPR
jgi:hypothetical protein